MFPQTSIRSKLPAGDSEVTVLVDVAGALPSQLQGDGGEVAGRRLHHQTAHRAAPGVEDVVKALLQELLSLRHAAGHHWIQVLVGGVGRGRGEGLAIKDQSGVHTCNEDAWQRAPFTLH